MINSQVFILENGTWHEITDDVLFPLFQRSALDESLDGGELRTKPIERSSIYQRYSHLKIVHADIDESGNKSNEETEYYVANDKSSMIVKFKPYKYEHLFVLTEPTKLLERMFIHGMAVTQPLNITQETKNVCKNCLDPNAGYTLINPAANLFRCNGCGFVAPESEFFTSITTGSNEKTVADVMDTLLATNPLRRVGDEQLYFLDEGLRDKLSKIKSCEFKWSCKMHLREVLQDIGAFIGAEPRLLPDPSDDRKYNRVSFDFYGVETGRDLSDIAYSAWEEDCLETDYCTELETVAENLIAQSDESQSTTTYPSEFEWVTPRTTQDIKLTQDNCELILPSNIYRVVNVWLKRIDGTFIKKYELNGKPAETHYNGYSVDPINIGESVFEEAMWNVLKDHTYSNSEYAQNNTLYYTTGSNTIKGLGTRTEGSYIITKILLTVLTGKKIRFYSEDSLSPNKIEEGELHNPRPSNNTELQFRIEYISLQSARCKSVRNYIENNTPNALAYNQQAEYNDSRKLGRHMWGANQRLGEKVQTVLYYHDSVEKTPRVNDKFNNYLVTEVERELIGMTSFKTKFTACKDFNRLHERISVNKKYRQWNIPADGIEKNLHYQNYCIIENEKKDNTSIAKNIISRFANVLQAKLDTQTEINCASLTANNRRVFLNAQSCGFGNSLMFTFKTQDNYSCGLRKSGEEVIDVTYANSKGEIESAVIKIGNSITNTNYHSNYADLLPDLNYSSSNQLNNMDVSNFIEGNFIVKKDAAEQINMTYQIHIVSPLEKLIIGEMLTQNNPLVKKFSKEKTFKCWRLNKPISKFAQIISDEGVQDNSITFTCERDGDSIKLQINNLPQNAAGWAITDENGYLYLAENEIIGGTRTLYMNLKKDRG